VFLTRFSDNRKGAHAMLGKGEVTQRGKAVVNRSAPLRANRARRESVHFARWRPPGKSDRLPEDAMPGPNAVDVCGSLDVVARALSPMRVA
jgi:hypothetical protein